jgi:hypothetical protein
MVIWAGADIQLEQRITSNKKNMRVAAQKYGF